MVNEEQFYLLTFSNESLLIKLQIVNDEKNLKNKCYENEFFPFFFERCRQSVQRTVLQIFYYQA